MTVAVRAARRRRIALIDMLDDFLAPLMFEIDIDVGRLAPLGAEKALEQHFELVGIDGGDAQKITDRGIRGRAAALAQNVPAFGIFHHVMHGQEIMRDFLFRDEAQFLHGLARDLEGRAFGIAALQSGFGQIAQMFVRGFSRRHRFVRIILFDLVEREADFVREPDRFRDCSGRGAKQARHFLGRLQMPFGIGFQPLAGRGQAWCVRGCR